MADKRKMRVEKYQKMKNLENRVDEKNEEKEATIKNSWWWKQGFEKKG